MSLYSNLEKDLRSGKMTRSDIVSKYKVSDYHARRVINKMRENGIRIISDESGNGYWISDSEEEYARFRKYYKHYADDIYKVIRAMDKGGDKKNV